MGVEASAQRGPPGADGKNGAPGKDAVVDYIELVNKTVTNDAFKNQVKALLGDQTFKSIVTDYMNANIGTFRGPKGETEFKNLTAEEQSQIITKLINNNMTTFSVQLMANNSFKDAILQMLESNPVNFKGLQGQQGPPGVGIKDASYDTATRNLMFIRTDNNTIGSFMVRGAEGPPGPAGTIDTPANTAWLQGRTMWCADGSCKTPTGNVLQTGEGDGDKIRLTQVATGSKIAHLPSWGVGIYAGDSTANSGFISFNTGTPNGFAENARVDSTGINLSAHKAISFSNSVDDKVYWWNPEYKTGIAAATLYHNVPTDAKHEFRVNGAAKAIISNSGLNVNGTARVDGQMNVKGNLVLGDGNTKKLMDSAHPRY